MFFRRQSKNLAALLTAVVLVTGCASGQRRNASTGNGPATLPAALPAATLVDLTYKESASLTDYERQRCKLDAYLPGGKNFSTVVWFYGGGLEAGDKNDPTIHRLGATLNRHGIALIAVNYRLSPKATYPAYVDDAAAGVAWTLAHIRDFGGDPKHVFVAGHSAGGFLTAAIGYDPKFLAQYGVKTSQIAGLIPVSPQVFTHYTIRKERGIANPQTTSVIDEAAPAFHIRPDAPPTLILIGDDDWPGRLEECRYFVRMSQIVKQPDVGLQVIAHRNHGSIAGNLPNEGDPALVALLAFVAGHQK